MFLSDRHLRILDALRHGELDQFEIAKQIDVAPFVVRGELQSLRRGRVVRDEMTRRRVVWSLTDAGWRVVLDRDQLSFEGGQG